MESQESLKAVVESKYSSRIKRRAHITLYSMVLSLGMGISASPTIEYYASKNNPFENEPIVIEYERAGKSLDTLRRMRRNITYRLPTKDDVPYVPKGLESNLDVIFSDDGKKVADVDLLINRIQSTLAQIETNPTFEAYRKWVEQKKYIEVGTMSGALALLALSMIGGIYSMSKQEELKAQELKALS